MANTSLELSRADIERYLARHLGWHPERGEWDATTQADADAIIGQGLRWFYNPIVLPGEKVAHQWSFMKPTYRFSTVSGQTEYDLPDDFAGIEDRLTYHRSDSAICEVQHTSEYRIRSLKQSNDAGVVRTGYPELFAVMPHESTAEQPQRYYLILWPSPAGAYELEAPYTSNPLLITGEKPYPLGGQPHAETILAAILAAAESNLEGKRDLRGVEFVERLAGSVSIDRRASAPANYGLNLDPGLKRFSRHQNAPSVSFNGTVYTANN
jgi:hypothetical protein